MIRAVYWLAPSEIPWASVKWPECTDFVQHTTPFLLQEAAWFALGDPIELPGRSGVHGVAVGVIDNAPSPLGPPLAYPYWRRAQRVWASAGRPSDTIFDGGTALFGGSVVLFRESVMSKKKKPVEPVAAIATPDAPPIVVEEAPVVPQLVTRFIALGGPNGEWFGGVALNAKTETWEAKGVYHIPRPYRVFRVEVTGAEAEQLDATAPGWTYALPIGEVVARALSFNARCLHGD